MGEERYPQTSREVADSIRKLASGPSPLKPAALAFRSYMGPWDGLLGLRFNAGPHTETTVPKALPIEQVTGWEPKSRLKLPRSVLFTRKQSYFLYPFCLPY